MTTKEDARWHAVIHYRTETGTREVECYLEEIEDLHVRVEHGPNWDTIEGIEVKRINPLYRNLTVERAAKM